MYQNVMSFGGMMNPLTYICNVLNLNLEYWKEKLLKITVGVTV